MNTLKHTKIYTILTVLTLATVAVVNDKNIFADQPVNKQQTNQKVDIKDIESKLALGDKKAEPIYKKMDSIHLKIEGIKKTDVVPVEKELIKKLNDLDENNSALLEKFRNETKNKEWENTSEAIELLSKTELTKNEKQQLFDYFTTNEKYQKSLDNIYKSFEEKTKGYNNQLIKLTTQTNDIYKSYGITESTLKAYYAIKGMTAD
ncbi:hypothetical protein N1495_01045 [Streptococcus didelphis]|uniref:Chromosome assembly-related protein n=1 Tax=Streptococcus didelphis TaxID=102886 RepID=A0ABY9LG92_9STRE|nr:hypothetical protein [Streptococcus didelphis]WMB27882.1 hypothetical protein N1496_07525 [Streptococcus didelphis]WMB29646.1 hypothetical protein N1495_01045 [Streptococcus didelphis]